MLLLGDQASKSKQGTIGESGRNSSIFLFVHSFPPFAFTSFPLSLLPCFVHRSFEFKFWLLSAGVFAVLLLPCHSSYHFSLAFFHEHHRLPLHQWISSPLTPIELIARIVSLHVTRFLCIVFCVQIFTSCVSSYFPTLTQSQLQTPRAKHVAAHLIYVYYPTPKTQNAKNSYAFQKSDCK